METGQFFFFTGDKWMSNYYNNTVVSILIDKELMTEFSLLGELSL